MQTGESRGGCVVCGSGEAHTSVSDPIDYEYAVVPENRFEYRRCESCDSEWLFPRPSDAEIAAFYPEGYHAYNDDHGIVARLLVGMRSAVRGRKYRSLLPNGRGSLFDVGAGDTRHFRELAQYADFEFSGVEIQPDVAARAREQGYDIATGTLETMDVTPHEGRHDIVSMNHVIEHVADTIEVMSKIQRMLRPGGWVIGQLPTNTGWESRVFGSTWAGYHYPRHLQVFSRKGLASLLERTGFTNTKIQSYPHCQIAISVQNALLEWGWKPRMEFGRSPIYGVLLAASLPFEVLAAVCNRSGVINFSARKPAA
ncbi:MAG: class I SAM-dependent methyltransferase [Myxococcota bacterium]|nr:class I SAM-dependent methyltransferase [Myxococcota bacterium]